MRIIYDHLGNVEEWVLTQDELFLVNEARFAAKLMNSTHGADVLETDPFVIARELIVAGKIKVRVPMGRRVVPVKPTGALTYTVSIGADVFPKFDSGWLAAARRRWCFLSDGD